MNTSTVERVVVDAYIRGIHGTQDREAIRKGFHEDFCMYVKEGGRIQKVGIEKWLSRIEEAKKQNPQLWGGETRHTFKLIDVTGSAACVKVEVYKNDVFFSTDYMLLYEFEDGWKIMSKIFSIPG